MAIDVEALGISSNPPALPPDSPIDDAFHGMEPISMTGLFNEATLYNQVVAERHPKTSSKTQNVQDFADLVGHDLNPEEMEVANRFAQLSLNDWAALDIDVGSPIHEEHPDEEELSSDVDTSSLFSHDESSTSSRSAGSHNASFDITDSSRVCVDGVSDRGSIETIPPKELVRILIEEFGQLGPDGEETLLAEIDGAIIQDVIVIGVVHVTTHRVTFHASLPDLDPTAPVKSRVIKSGTVVVHRKGLHRKRRVWLELSNDFISAYPSAQEEDHIRPLRSARLGAIHDILPEDPEHPRFVRFTVEGDHGTITAVFEFDTTESAREWRRDFSVTLFYYRRRLHNLFVKPGTEDAEGVRINIPLDRIDKLSHRLQAGLLPIVTFTISSAYAGNSTLPKSAPENIQVIELAVYKANERWEHITELVAESKLRIEKERLRFPERPVVIEFGLENSIPDLADLATHDSQPHKSKEAAIADVLAIEYTPDVWVTRACIIRRALLYKGFLVVSRQWVGFWSKSLALQDLHYRIATSSIRSAAKDNHPARLHGITLEIEGHHNLNFFLTSEADRNEAIKRINDVKGGIPGPVLTESPSDSPADSPPPSPVEERPSLELEPLEHRPLPPPVSPPRKLRRSTSHTAILAPPSRRYTTLPRHNLDPTNILQFPKPVNLPPGMDLLHPLPRHFVCLTIGSRGDVQPYIALGKRLKKDGHRVTIVTHVEYKEWITGFGLDHREAGGDPGALMQLSVENKMFSPQFIKQSLTTYRSWLDDLLRDAWKNCRDAEVLLESPYAMAGVHIAEALQIPYFRVCTMPWTKTTAFPHPFIGPPLETPHANALSYVLFDNILWAATSGQVNRWRKEYLKLDPTNMGHGPQSKIPVLYNFSPASVLLAVVPKPLDWSDSKIECGYWFLDNPDPDWFAPESLLRFMREARQQNKPLVYIGFGSITVPNPQAMTEHIYQAVKKSGVRAIVSRGWSGRMAKKVQQDIEIPDEVYAIDKIPHDWLFPQIDAALHHGGAGTTGASLRAGIPTLIKPWFGDQYFWASRVHQLGAGLRVPSLRVSDLTHALTKATSDRIMKEKAAIVGQKIRSEDGCGVAMRAIYTYLPRATSGGISPE
ncbi:hypothetical protein BDY19DRAFT_994648 [Irpex rosettiformis]|uniref:Uncharacterized protein n=1 Tax=Irpex rosettiformis TaxID=378272 RepID=A0ACB8U0D3_9APHY|nr:hypothetical protein BDY19DRAFT_994648 [Irpex rosettiformis]